MDRVESTVNNLNKHGFQARAFDTAAEARAAAMELLGGRSVGFGGSVTVRDMGLYEALKEKGNSVHWHWRAEESGGMPEAYAKARAAEAYVSSSNAVLEEGALLNIDGTGNRVANLFYGPGLVLIIAGENKIEAGYDAALSRIKREACPQNARRLNMPTPCAVKECNDCNSEKRMCRVTVLLERPTFAVPNVHVYLVRQALGY